MTETDLSDEVALVTGGGSGIGAQLCVRLASRGASVVVADVDEAGAQSVADETGGMALRLDVAQSDAWNTAMASVIDQHGRLDIIALNAGIMIRPRGLPTDDDPLAWVAERYELIRSVNMDGVVLGIMAALPHLEKVGGRIVVTASAAGLKPLEIDPVYAMTKAGLIGLVRSMAGPLGRRGITIGAVCPGAVDTPLVAPDLRDGARDFATPDHVARALEAVLDKPAADSGGIWISRAGHELWRQEFISPDVAPDSQTP